MKCSRLDCITTPEVTARGGVPPCDVGRASHSPPPYKHTCYYHRCGWAGLLSDRERVESRDRECLRRAFCVTAGTRCSMRFRRADRDFVAILRRAGMDHTASPPKLLFPSGMLGEGRFGVGGSVAAQRALAVPSSALIVSACLTASLLRLSLSLVPRVGVSGWCPHQAGSSLRDPRQRPSYFRALCPYPEIFTPLRCRQPMLSEITHANNSPPSDRPDHDIAWPC